MSKVEFIYGKGGKKVKMARRTAEALRKMGYGTYADTSVEAGYQTRMLTAAITPTVVVVEEPLVSEAIAEFAKENGVDIEKIVGTGKDGRIKKSDVEAAIAVQV
jgi:pyruvate/2-oxoglutarate dehydrogenase complex dihydrolipoamide acyltransferase (E2) component